MTGADRPTVRCKNVVVDEHGRVSARVQVRAPASLGGVAVAERSLCLTDAKEVEALISAAGKAWARAAAGLNGTAPAWDGAAVRRSIETRAARARRDNVPEPARAGGEARVPYPVSVYPAALACGEARVPYPVSVYPAALACYVTEMAAAHDCPIDYPAATVLAVAAGCIGASRALAVKPGWTEVPSVYMAIVGPAGEGKSPVLDRVSRAVYQHQRDLEGAYQGALQDYEAEMANFNEAMAARLRVKEDRRKARPSRPAEPVMERVLAEDITAERLASLLRDSPRGLLMVRDELMALFSGMNQYRASGKGNERQAYLSMWSGAARIIDRQKLGQAALMLTHGHLSLVGGMVPALLPAITEGHATEDGFAQRMLWCYPLPHAPGKWRETAVSPAAEAAWEKCLRFLWELPMSSGARGLEPVVLPFTDEGKAAWVRWYDAHAEEVAAADFLPEFRGPWMKLRAYAARLALVLQLLRVAYGEAKGEAVDAVSVEGAAALAGYYKDAARRVFRRLEADPGDTRVERVIEWLDKHPEPCSARDLQRAGIAGIRKSSEAQRVLEELVDRGFGVLQEVRRGVRGPATTAFILARPEPVPEAPSSGPISSSTTTVDGYL